VKDPDPAFVSLVGGVWVRSAGRGNGSADETRLKFRPDGTFTLATITPEGELRTSTDGCYTLADGRLILTAEGHSVLTVTVRWVLDDIAVLSCPASESRWIRARR
jgi:hypothetical protein